MKRGKHQFPKGVRRDCVLLAPDEIEKMRSAGRLAARILDAVAAMLRPGISTGDIDRLVDRMTRDHGALSAPLGYPRGGENPFPKHCCTSVNEVICHGIPSDRHVLREGDIINVDVTPTIEGYHGDTSRTFLIGEVSERARRLVAVTEECLRIGIAQVRPGGRVGDIGAAIQPHAEAHGYSVVTAFAGHGIGRVFHGPPLIPHVGKRGAGPPLIPGMTFTIEPMINEGTERARILSDKWTAVTADGTLSAQFEHTVCVTETGVDILTLGEGRTLDLVSPPRRW